MAEKDKIRLLRGLEADIPAALPSGCPAFSTDTHKFFIGTGAGRKEVGAGGSGTWGGISGDIADQTDLQDELDKKARIIHSATEPSDAVEGDYWSSGDSTTDIKNEIFNSMFPVGIYTIGQHPDMGDWEEIVDGDVVKYRRTA